MILTEDEIKNLIKDSKEILANLNLAVVYNAIGFTRKINKNHESTDFFFNEEIGEIFDSLILNGITVLPYSNELDFIHDIMENRIDLNNLTVWNLSRQGSNNNQKSLITSLCDFKNIPYIGSSVYAMNLARNKFHFQKILKAEGLAWIPTFSIEEFFSTTFQESDRFLLKKSNGSASRGILSEATNISQVGLIEYIKKNSIPKDLIVQKFVEGYEVEVPLFQLNGKFKAIGLAGISINGSKYLSGETLPEESLEHNSKYSFYDFPSFAINCLNFEEVEYIYQVAIEIANLLGLKDYCRIDFRVDNSGNLYCFDISTTPYVTHHSSPNYLLNKGNFLHRDLLALVFSAFNSNVGSH